MGKIAFVFSGQGAQFSGMGKEIYDCSQAAKDVFNLADSIREGTSRQCFEGTEEELKVTKNTQPCLYAVEMACAAALTEAGVKADCAAGFSLGELAALTYGGVVDLESGLKLVNKRAELMQAAASEADTSMAAVMKLPNEKVEELAAGFDDVYPVNYNCPGQLVVAMLSSQMDAFSAAVKEAGGRAIPVKVSGAFHSPYMKGASEKFGKELANVQFKQPEIKVYSNYLGDVYTEDVAKLLEVQICNPVKWETIVRNMIADGVDTFIELGAGKTLCNLIKKTDATVRLYNVATKEDIEKIVEEVK